ncbi:LLM class flavin-dependent oxidoreductase [Nocardia sp. NPDC006044]|uniref:LLM class flavin-dependent oxidoreductase n=1 Tax=Nocardia sp. NPDC006044 TaxID=3364306 RepID=UPI0036C168AF
MCPARTAAIIDHARLAEQLGYHRLRVFESPALHTDLWIGLARAAASTQRIGLGAGVAVAGLRHPMVAAAAASSVTGLAPGRLTVTFGTGRTARRVLGQRAVRVVDLVEEVRQVRSFAGGPGDRRRRKTLPDAAIAGFGPPCLIEVPIWLAAAGPHAFAAATDLRVPGVLVTDTPDRSWLNALCCDSGRCYAPSRTTTSASPASRWQVGPGCNAPRSHPSGTGPALSCLRLVAA